MKLTPKRNRNPQIRAILCVVIRVVSDLIILVLRLLGLQRRFQKIYNVIKPKFDAAAGWLWLIAQQHYSVDSPRWTVWVGWLRYLRPTSSFSTMKQLLGANMLHAAFIGALLYMNSTIGDGIVNPLCPSPNSVSGS